ncbi:VOC family protein [Actinoplanes awajinensis]|uniref:Glyoxalase n=1 Tax=Actinoplanes awajinensis subsp. mycoplanecinus TaxID=135947 RepID=A0A0X3V2S9_9ACTN|nr:VOC family protein [Actinoplanes awajinensis]KUL39040.1 glyoxalase [Actinoplanes awajinensis subsp. mycoplanecinus]
MRIRSSALALTVDDVPASSKFLADHFGYVERMAADGFASLGRDDAGLDLMFMRRGLEVLPPHLREVAAAGAIVAFVVDDLDAEQDRLRAEGVELTLPIREEPWGERLLLVTDPNGVVYELVEWAETEPGR